MSKLMHPKPEDAASLADTTKVAAVAETGFDIKQLEVIHEIQNYFHGAPSAAKAAEIRASLFQVANGNKALMSTMVSKAISEAQFAVEHEHVVTFMVSDEAATYEQESSPEAITARVGFVRSGIDYSSLDSSPMYKGKSQDDVYISPDLEFEIDGKKYAINFTFLGDTAGGVVEKDPNTKYGSALVAEKLEAIISDPTLPDTLKAAVSGASNIADTMSRKIIELLASMIKNEKFSLTTCDLLINIKHTGKIFTSNLHLGDGRVYEMSRSNPQLNQITKDHNYAGLKNRIYLALDNGVAQNITNTIASNTELFQTREITEPTLRLICSDGLHDMLTPEELNAIAQEAWQEYTTLKSFNRANMQLQRIIQKHIAHYMVSLETPKKPDGTDRKIHDDISFIVEWIEPSTDQETPSVVWLDRKPQSL